MSDWLLVALIAPFLWSLVTLLDIYFVDQVYEEAHEGTVIIGLLQGCTLFLIPFVGFVWPGSIAGLLFIAGGIAYITSFHWYFKSMFLFKDGALIQIFFNIAVIVVPVFAWILIGEKLGVANYIGIILAFVGSAALAWDGKIQKKDLSAVFWMMVPAMLLFSLSMVLQKKGYEMVGDHGFWSGIMLFSCGSVISGIVILLLHTESKKLFVRIRNLGRKYFFVFILTEVMFTIGTLTSQRAISLSPGVSLVAAIESIVPLFVILNGLLIAFFFRKHAIGAVYAGQVAGLKGKLIAIAFIAMGIYLVA